MGVVVVVQFLFMNSSTPILDVRWCLRTFTKQRRKSILAAGAAFAVALFLAWVWLVGKVLGGYG